MSDLLLFENHAAPGVPREDTEEAANYLVALNHGLESIRSGRLPLCNRLLREVHGLLLGSGRGSDMAPGTFRRDQNWIGGSRPGDARYVPPPWTEVAPLMSNLEKVLHNDPEPTPILVKAAVAQAQFETIHPFLDGNGRLGRLLITLLLAAEGVLRRPLLYLSLFLKQNRDAYYDHLQRVRPDGTWEAWLRAPRVAEDLGLTEPPVYAAIGRLEEIGILREVTGRQRGKLYAYDEYLGLLDEGTTEPAG